MPHVDEGTLHAYLDGAIDALIADGALPNDMTRSDIDAHLATCADCRSLFEAERSVREHAGQVLRAAGAGPIVVPPFSEIRAGWTPSTPEIFDPPRSWVPLAWAASVLVALGAGWFGSSLLQQSSTTLADATTSTAPVVRTMESGDALAPTVGEPVAEESARDAASLGMTRSLDGADVALSPAPPALRREAQTVIGASGLGGVPVAGVPQRFREAVDSARNTVLVWRTVAQNDPMAQALGIVNVDGAQDMRVSIAALPNGLGSIARVEQRLDTGEPFELLVWREPTEVAAALEISRRERALAFSTAPRQAQGLVAGVASPAAAEAMRKAAGPRRAPAAVLASDVLPAGQSRVLALMHDDMTYVAIHGAIETSRLTGLADRLVEIRDTP